MGNEQKLSPEEGFREGLRDVVAISEGLVGIVTTLEELVGMAKLALENDGQLKLLFAAVTAQAKKR